MTAYVLILWCLCGSAPEPRVFAGADAYAICETILAIELDRGDWDDGKCLPIEDAAS